MVRYFQKALSGRGIVIATNSHADAPGMLAADRAVVIPGAAKPNFIESLLGVCRQYRVRLLCSLHDWEIPFISQAVECFRYQGVFPVVSSPNVVQTCLDKFAFVEFARKRGMRVPETAIGLSRAIQGLADNSLRFPLVVKPRYGQGSIGVEAVYSEDELRCACLMNEARIARMESNELLWQSDEENLIIQEKIDGVEYGLDVVNDLQGRFAACFVKRKIAMRAGETDMAEILDNPELDAFGRTIGEELGHIGVLDVDVMVDEYGPCLLEANPRFGGHYPFSHEAGADVPSALIAWAQGYVPDPACLKTKPGMRYFKDIKLVSDLGKSNAV